VTGRKQTDVLFETGKMGDGDELRAISAVFSIIFYPVGIDERKRYVRPSA